MRVSDDRYTRDRQRLDLALRLIRHEARTFTIRQWTGLSDDRVRKLYRSYVLDHSERRVFRHRGKSPRQAAFFFRSVELNFQAAQLASLFVMYGLMRGTSSRLEPQFRVGSLESGALLCRAYEAYLELHAPASISFEHAWFLLMALTRQDEVGVARCGVCGGMRLRDLLAKRRLACGTCGPGAEALTVSMPLGGSPPVIGCSAPC
jgi:Flagellar transcriptional activator (FlhC)